MPTYLLLGPPAHALDKSLSRQGMAKSRTPLGAHTSAWRTYPNSDLLPHGDAGRVRLVLQPPAWACAGAHPCRAGAVVDQSRRPDDGPGPVHMHALMGFGNHSCVWPGRLYASSDQINDDKRGSRLTSG